MGSMNLLRGMVAKGAKDACGMETGSHVRSLIREIKIGNFSLQVLKQEHVAGSDISVDDRRLCLLVEVLESSGGINGDPHPLHPIKNRARLRPLNSFPPCEAHVKI